MESVVIFIEKILNNKFNRSCYRIELLSVQEPPTLIYVKNSIET